MADIQQATSEHHTEFSALSTEADKWMKEKYGDMDINLPPDEAKAFKKAAVVKGFSFAIL